jgi:hypothetical protein
MHHRQRAEDRVVAIKALTSADERWVRDLGAGYHLVRLLSSAALDEESKAMRHCIGHGAYDDHLEDAKYACYSVRDADGKRHATLETMLEVIVQFEGPANKPAPQYVVDLIDGVRAELGWITAEEALERSAQSSQHLIGMLLGSRRA